MMDVVIDDREPRDAVLVHLQRIPGVRTAVHRLHVGDYRVDNRLVIERKTVSDFSLSLVQGRLLSQACRLARASVRSVYVLEGDASGWRSIGVRRESVQGAMVAITVCFGIPLLRSQDPGETARLIYFAGEQMSRAARGAVPRPGYRPRGKRKRRLFVLQGLPGVGPHRAARLLDAFGSLEAVFRADAKELARVEGIGQNTARSIRSLVEAA